MKYFQLNYRKTISATLSVLIILACFTSISPLKAQSYDDYADFAADPILLDQEANRIFGRFFQNSLLVGTGVFLGDLGKANSAGFMIGMRFVFYFDKVWGLELQAGYARHATLYDELNTNTLGIDLQMNTHLLPFHVGVRYGFDQESLPRGFVTMNPYIAIAGQLTYRSERVVGTPTTSGLEGDAKKFEDRDIINSNAIGMNVGGGVEFDVYKNRMLLGFDVRYHVIFWGDAGIRMGNPTEAKPLERSGGYMTILASLTYNY